MRHHSVFTIPGIGPDRAVDSRSRWASSLDDDLGQDAVPAARDDYDLSTVGDLRQRGRDRLDVPAGRDGDHRLPANPICIGS